MSRRDDRGARSLHCRGYDTTRIGERDLRHVFSTFGKVIDVYLPKDFFTKEQRGFAYIQFEKESDADAARLKLDRTDVFQDDHPVSIMWAAGDRKTPTDMRRLDIERDNPHARRERDRRRRMDDRRFGDADHDRDRDRGRERGRERDRDRDYHGYRERERDDFDRYRDDRPRHGFGGRGRSRSPPRRRNPAYYDGDGGPPRRNDRYDDRYGDRLDDRDRERDREREHRSVSPGGGGNGNGAISRKRGRNESPDQLHSDGRRDGYRGRSRSRSRSPLRRRTSARSPYRPEDDRNWKEGDQDMVDRERKDERERNGGERNGVMYDNVGLDRHRAFDGDGARGYVKEAEDGRGERPNEEEKVAGKEEEGRYAVKEEPDSHLARGVKPE